MAGCKVHCISEMAAAAPDDVPPCPTSSKRESFTVWMKSLIMQGNGCTVYNEKGEVVYRMDNYDSRQSREVYLMDLQGRVVFTIVKRVSFVLPALACIYWVLPGILPELKVPCDIRAETLGLWMLGGI